MSDEELVNELTKNGAINIQRLNRGTNFDRVEAINKKVPFAKEKLCV